MINHLASPLQAKLRMLAGAMMISFSAVFVRLVDTGPTVSGFYRVAIGAAVLLIYLFVRDRQLLLSDKWVRWLLVLAALFFAADLWVWHRSILAVGPGLSTLLGNLQVVLVPVVAWALFAERLGKYQLMAIPVALAGLAMMLGFGWKRTPWL